MKSCKKSIVKFLSSKGIKIYLNLVTSEVKGSSGHYLYSFYLPRSTVIAMVVVYGSGLEIAQRKRIARQESMRGKKKIDSEEIVVIVTPSRTSSTHSFV